MRLPIGSDGGAILFLRFAPECVGSAAMRKQFEELKHPYAFCLRKITVRDADHP
jgi:hypothetical protein